MDKPMADSAAATVKMKMENTWPKRSSKYTEKIMKLRLTANNINSIDINIIIMFFLFKKIPQTPITNKPIATVKYFTRSIIIMNFSSILFYF